MNIKRINNCKTIPETEECSKCQFVWTSICCKQIQCWRQEIWLYTALCDPGHTTACVEESEDAGAVGLSLTTYWLTTWAPDIQVSLSIPSLVKWEQQQPHRFKGRRSLDVCKVPSTVSGVYASMNTGYFKNKVWKKSHLSALGTEYDHGNEITANYILGNLDPNLLAVRSAYSFSTTWVIQTNSLGIMEFIKVWQSQVDLMFMSASRCRYYVLHFTQESTSHTSASDRILTNVCALLGKDVCVASVHTIPESSTRLP